MSEPIYDYMKARAKAEDQNFNLKDEYFVANLLLGVRNFFGVEIDDEGELLRDEQNPVFFNWYHNKEGANNG